MDLLAHHRRAEEIRRELTEELSAKLTLSAEEKQKVDEKWSSTSLISKLEEPKKPKEFIVRCAGRHAMVLAEGSGAWLCQGSGEPFADACKKGSHTNDTHYKCKDYTCTHDGVCEEHYNFRLQKLKDADRDAFMSSYISTRGSYIPTGNAHKNVSPRRR